jgi:hypothetical protein
MARTPPQAIEIAAKATLDSPFATISWSFVRLQVGHKFEMVVVQDEKDRSLAIRDNAFTMAYPLTFRQREEYRRKHPRMEVPTAHTKKFAINNPHYKDMIQSVKLLLLQKPLIDDARTSPNNMAYVRFPEFVYPAWYRKRDASTYDPRSARLVTPTPAPAATANGLDALAASPLAAIVNAHTPVPPIRTYEQGVTAASDVIEKMAMELHQMAMATSGEGAKIFNGYVAMLTEAKARIGKLME